VPAISETRLLAIVAVAFVIFHIVVAVVLINPSAGPATATQDNAQHAPYD
jgi:hypothetical protein